MSQAVAQPSYHAIPVRSARSLSWQRGLRSAAIGLGAFLLLAWTVFPFFWILLTSLKSPGDMLSVPPKFLFEPTLDN
ncbi:MAG: hypothetical protein K2X74_11030, partial [Acetobacteraceae bacterium]|nr:hypothetical protein [Acetobacteraceae bacterium]